MAYRKISINDKEMEFKASALTPVLFHQVFKIDLLLALEKFEEKDPEKLTSAENLEYFTIMQKLGFVMAKQAEAKKLSDLSKLSIDNYYAWLDDFDNINDIPISEITQIYYFGDLVDVESKKEAAEPSEN